jgi:transcriptional regulator with XRE-family HTH domain
MSEKLLHLQRIRKEKDLTLSDLSKLSGVALLTIQKLESGTTPITQAKLDTLIKIAKALHCKVVDLLPKELRNNVG